MTVYYDSGIILKLYTSEPESAAARRYVLERNEPLYLNSLHRSECTAAFRLKAFRRECKEEAASRAIADFEDDVARGVIRIVEPDWSEVWNICRNLLDKHAASTGCRTLDSLHVACARSLAIRDIITSDKRQSALARRAGMIAISLL